MALIVKYIPRARRFTGKNKKHGGKGSNLVVPNIHVVLYIRSWWKMKHSASQAFGRQNTLPLILDSKEVGLNKPLH